MLDLSHIDLLNVMHACAADAGLAYRDGNYGTACAQHALAARFAHAAGLPNRARVHEVLASEAMAEMEAALDARVAA